MLITIKKKVAAKNDSNRYKSTATYIIYYIVMFIEIFLVFVNKSLLEHYIIYCNDIPTNGVDIAVPI